MREGTAGEPGLARTDSYRGLTRIGGVSAYLYVVLAVVPIVLLVTAPWPPATGGAAVLQYIASNKAVYLVELVSFVGLSLPGLVVFAALYPVLEKVNRSLAALGAVIGIGSETVALALGSSPQSLSGGLV